jgi:hypothetical protein
MKYWIVLISLLLAAVPASADTMITFTWSGEGQSTGQLGTSATFTQSGVSLTAYSYCDDGSTKYSGSCATGTTYTNDLYNNAGGSGVDPGLGTTEGGDAIDTVDYVEIDFSNVLTNYTIESVTLEISPLDTGQADDWAVYSASTDGGSLPGTMTEDATGTNNTAYTLTNVVSSSKPVLAVTADCDIVIQQVELDLVAKTPEPATLGLMAGALLLLGWRARRSRA